MKEFKYYNEQDDLIKSKDQNYKLKENYKYLHKNIFYIILSYIVYYLVLVIAFIYCKLIKRIKYINKNKLKGKGYFVYSNHTLTLGDVLNPFLINFPNRPYILCSPANLGIPIIGKILPIAGALPIPDTIKGQKELMKTINILSKNHPIIIYPEAHLWPYYTKIRPFNTSAFHYPIDNKRVSYSQTTTFQNKRIIIYIDGPFKIDDNLSRRENIKLLRDNIYNSLVIYSKKSNYQKYIYKKL